MKPCMRFVATALLLLLLPLGVLAQGEGWTPESMMKVRPVGPVRVSPDGRRVAYVVTDAVMTPERSEYVSQIYVANSDGTAATQLTFADKFSPNPQWAPDGAPPPFN